MITPAKLQVRPALLAQAFTNRLSLEGQSVRLSVHSRALQSKMKEAKSALASAQQLNTYFRLAIVVMPPAQPTTLRTRLPIGTCVLASVQLMFRQ
jgi:hypothetical protein